ncbi:MAG: AEC family transporter [Rubrivivax sp.]
MLSKLLALIASVALGYVAGRMRWLGDSKSDPAKVLSAAAFYIFVPALLFRTTARIDLHQLPWRILLAYFVPAVVLLLAVYAWLMAARRKNPAVGVAAPSIRALSVTFGNSVQMCIPLAAALFGEAGLGLHLMLISLHALILLSVATVLVELDLARERARQDVVAGLGATLRSTARNTLIHPVVLPVLAGMGWSLSGLGLAPAADEVLQLLGSAVVPLCLVLIGLSLAYYGMQGHARGAVWVSVLKLLLLPALVLVVARWGFGLGGLPLAVMVMMAAVPVGANPLIFAQRYGALQAQTTAAIVVSTLAFGLTAPLWLWVLSQLPA